MTTYTWLIEALNCVVSSDGKSNVVNNIHWRVDATDGTNNATHCGAQGVAYDAQSTFIAYEDITKEMALTWVKEAMGADAVIKLEQALDRQLQNLDAPTVVTLPLPW